MTALCWRLRALISRVSGAYRRHSSKVQSKCWSRTPSRLASSKSSGDAALTVATSMKYFRIPALKRWRFSSKDGRETVFFGFLRPKYRFYKFLFPCCDVVLSRSRSRDRQYARGVLKRRVDLNVKRWRQGLRAPNSPASRPLEEPDLSALNEKYAEFFKAVKEGQALPEEKITTADVSEGKLSKEHLLDFRKGFYDIIDRFVLTYAGKKSKKELLADVLRITDAFSFMLRAHEGQTRDDGRPYAYHTISVARYGAFRGMDAEDIMASLLHDVVEDRGVEPGELSKRFGRRVARTVTLDSKLKVRLEAKPEDPHVEIIDVRHLYGGRETLPLVSPYHPLYQAAETDEEAKLRRQYRELIVRRQLDNQLSEESAIPVDPRFLAGKTDHVSDEWSALNIRLGDVRHNLETLLGKLKKTWRETGNPQDVMNEFHAGVKNRMEFALLFSHAAPTFMQELPAAVLKELSDQLVIRTAVDDISVPKSKAFSDVPDGLAYTRHPSRRQVRRSTFSALEPASGANSVVHLGDKPHVMESLFSRPLILSESSPKSGGRFLKSMVKEMSLQLGPLSGLDSVGDFRSFTPTFPYARSGRSMLFPNDPRYFVIESNLRQLPKDLRHQALDYAMHHAIALHSEIPLSELPEDILSKFGREYAGLRWMQNPRDSNRISLFVPFPQRSIGTAYSRRIKKLSASIKDLVKRDYLSNGRVHGRHSERPTFHWVTIRLHPEWVKLNRVGGIIPPETIERNVIGRLLRGITGRPAG